jgi:hypothetical protein
LCAWKVFAELTRCNVTGKGSKKGGKELEAAEEELEMLNDELEELEELTSYQLDMLKDELEERTPKPWILVDGNDKYL